MSLPVRQTVTIQDGHELHMLDLELRGVDPPDLMLYGHKKQTLEFLLGPDGIARDRRGRPMPDATAADQPKGGGCCPPTEPPIEKWPKWLGWCSLGQWYGLPWPKRLTWNPHEMRLEVRFGAGCGCNVALRRLLERFIVRQHA